MPPRSSPCLFALLLLAPFAAGAQPFLDWNGLKPGPYKVGFKAVAAVDATRTFQTPTDWLGRPRPAFGNRPVQISTWYPAKANPGGMAMTWGDYVALTAWELGPAREGPAARREAERGFVGAEAPRATAEVEAAYAALFRQPVLARRDAKAAAGRFPVLLSAPGQGLPAFDNSVMAEYLASHGYVVIASPSVGPDGREMPDSPIAIDTQARDLEFLAGHAQSLGQVDPDRMAAMGFSLGGAGAALFTLRNARIRALVHLDGVLREDRYLEQLRGFPQFRPEGLRASLLWISCAPANSPPGSGDGAFQQRARHAEVVEAVIPGVRHHDLTSMMALQRRRAQAPGQDFSQANAGYEAASRLVLAFLDSRLKGLDRDVAAAAAPAEVTVRPAHRPPPAPLDVVDAARRDGVARAAELVEILKREAPDSLPALEVPIVLLGYEALAAPDPKRAAGLFSLALEAAPGSIDGSYGLARACAADGALERAEGHYRAAREKVERSPELAAEQKAGILVRIDKLLEELRGRVSGKPSAPE